jgi:hypothetical protein
MQKLCQGKTFNLVPFIGAFRWARGDLAYAALHIVAQGCI